MKRIAYISIGVLSLAIAIPAFAVLPPVGYIGMFADTDHAANSICPPQYGVFHAWIWCLPSENGLQGAQFAVRFPETAVTGNITMNPAISPVIGSLQSGTAFHFDLSYCQTDWVWTHDITLIILAALPSTIDIISNPWAYPAPAYEFMTCEWSYPWEPCINLTPLYICWSPDPGPISAEETNWGAIKALYK